jgi:hypothetical protein
MEGVVLVIGRCSPGALSPYGGAGGRGSTKSWWYVVDSKMLQVVSVTQRTSHEDTLSGASQALTRYSVGSKRQQYVARSRCRGRRAKAEAVLQRYGGLGSGRTTRCATLSSTCIAFSGVLSAHCLYGHLSTDMKLKNYRYIIARDIAFQDFTPILSA